MSENREKFWKAEPKKMASAPPAKIRFLFQPLGFFNRGQALIDIAKEITERFNGEVPKTYDELVSIREIA